MFRVARNVAVAARMNMVRSVIDEDHAAILDFVVGKKRDTLIFHGIPRKAAQFGDAQTPVGFDGFDDGAQRIDVRGNSARRVVGFADELRGDDAFAPDFDGEVELTQKFNAQIGAALGETDGRRRFQQTGQYRT